MKPITSANQAIQLMRKFIILSKPYGGEIVFYTLENEAVLVIHNNFRAYITIDDFIRDFHESKYYLYTDANDVEVEKEAFVKLRQ